MGWPHLYNSLEFLFRALIYDMLYNVVPVLILANKEYLELTCMGNRNTYIFMSSCPNPFFKNNDLINKQTCGMQFSVSAIRIFR